MIVAVAPTGMVASTVSCPSLMVQLVDTVREQFRGWRLGEAPGRVRSGFDKDVFVAGPLGVCVESGNVAVQELSDRAECVVVLAHVAD